MTGASLQTVADVRSTTGVRHRAMIDALLTLKINNILVLKTDACLMTVASMIMSIVRYQKRFTLGTLHCKIVHRKLSWGMRGILVRLRL
jgi:hypothetical protein